MNKNAIHFYITEETKPLLAETQNGHLFLIYWMLDTVQGCMKTNTRHKPYL